MMGTGAGDVGIARLLERNGARMIDAAGDARRALGRSALTRRLWEEFAAFDPIRRSLAPVNSRGLPFRPASSRQDDLLRTLTRDRWIQVDGTGVPRCVNAEAERYLRGGWLEELAWLAVRAGGATEAVLGQKIEWTVGEHVGFNEIDVLARRGAVLSVTSCKTACPVVGASQRERLHDFLLEVGYWEEHFAAGEGRALLLVTTDLVDEAIGAVRVPTLFARAAVLDIELVGLDHDRFDALVAAYRRHWDGA